jgi:hypothetical protein
VPYFDDPEVGFVQCPHAYRDYEGSAYGRMVTVRYDRHVPESLVELKRQRFRWIYGPATEF